MKQVYGIIIFLIAFSFCSILYSESGKNTIFYVSQTGNDSWTGKLSEPDSKGADGPFATLEKARDTIRELKKTGDFPEGGVTILVRKGNYYFTQTLSFIAEDTGGKDSPIFWSSYPGEKVTFIGGTILKGFEPVNEPSGLNRIDENIRVNVFQCDLKNSGVADLNDMEIDLFCNNDYMTRARYPNEGWLHIADVPQDGEKLMYEGDVKNLGVIFDGIPAGKHYGRFTYDGDRPERWPDRDDIWMRGFFVWDWYYAYQKVAKIDKINHDIYPAEPYHHYGYRKGQRFFFVNILEELDSPGEFYIDSNKKILYFWPPVPIEKATVIIPVMTKPMISFENTEYLTIRRLNFSCSGDGAISIKGGTKNLVAGCTFTNFGGTVISVSGGTYNGVTSCDIYNVSKSGISISGGDRKTLTPSGNFATNNYIHHYSRTQKSNTYAISFNGVGNRIANNLIHDAPHHAFGGSGNENVIEYNEIYDVIQETGDAGALHIGRDWTQRGNKIQFNYWHDIHGPKLEGPAFSNAIAVYLDDMYSGTLVYGNLFQRVDWGVLLGGGHDNTVENNIFIDCGLGISGDRRSQSWGKINFAKGSTVWKRLEEMPYNIPPWSEKYPKLAKILDKDPLIPSGNFITHNVYFGPRWMSLADGAGFENYEIKDNVISAPVLFNWQKVLGGPRTEVKYGEPEIMKQLRDFGNIVMDSDPGFVDIKGKNPELKKNSPAWKLGFKPIPFKKMGLYTDEYRKKLP